jgi:hypothetical protein
MLLTGVMAVCRSGGQGSGLGVRECRAASSSASSSGPAEGLGVVKRMPCGMESHSAGSKVGMGLAEGSSRPRSLTSRLSRAFPERSGVGASAALCNTDASLGLVAWAPKPRGVPSAWQSSGQRPLVPWAARAFARCASMMKPS